MQEGHFTYFKWKGINSRKEMLTELLERLEQWEPEEMDFKNLFLSLERNGFCLKLFPVSCHSPLC